MLFLNPYSISLMFQKTMLDNKTPHNSQNRNHCGFAFVCWVSVFVDYVGYLNQ